MTDPSRAGQQHYGLCGLAVLSVQLKHSLQKRNGLVIITINLTAERTIGKLDFRVSLVVCLPPIKGFLLNKKHISVRSHAASVGCVRIYSSLHINAGRVLQAVQLLSFRNKASSRLFFTRGTFTQPTFVDVKPTFSSQICVHKYHK